MKRTTKALSTTLGLTIILFGFIVFLLYVIYCYAYYDKYMELEYTNSFNNGDYNFVFDKMVGKGNLTYEQFTYSLDKLTDKERLNEIFDSYYKDSGIYNKEDFLDTYLYKLNNVVESDIKFSTNGKTNLFTRRAIFYDEIKITNNKSYTNIGVFNKISFKVEDNSILRVDNKELECINNVCIIDKIYGGIHEISYASNGYEYYALVNITKDKKSIEVTNLDSLVKVREANVALKYGRYLLTNCNGFCPIINKSYLMINEDNTYYLYDYHKDGQNYNASGEYSVNGNYITIDKEIFMITGSNLVESNNRVTYTYTD